jgi:hypothetical protein
MDEKCRQKAKYGFAECNFQKFRQKVFGLWCAHQTIVSAVKKAEYGLAKCNFQNSDKKYSAYGVCTKQLFLPLS